MAFFEYDDYNSNFNEELTDNDLVLSTESETNNNIKSFDKHYYFYNYYKKNREYLLNKQAIKKPCLYCSKNMRYDCLNKHKNKYCNSNKYLF